MTTISALESGRSPRTGFHRERAVRQLLQAGAVVLAALPLALIGVGGWVGVVGVIYAAVWAFVVLPLAGVYLVLLLDPFQILIGRPALFLPRILANTLNQRIVVRRSLRRVRGFSAFAWWVNPLSNVVLAAHVLAARWRPKLYIAAFEEAIRLAKQLAPLLENSAPEPTSELARPVTDIAWELERELQLC
jgi:hypothetical protein